MERKKEIGGIEFEKYLNRKKSTGKYGDAMIALARGDFERGLTVSQIDRYLQTRHDLEQMKVLSSCIGGGCPEGLLDILCGHGMTAAKMSQAAGLHDEGVALAQIGVMMNGGEDSLKAAMTNAAEKAELAKEAAQGEPPYVARMMEALSELADKFIEQGDRLGEFEEKMDALGQPAADDLITELFEQVENRDGQIRALQDKVGQMNEARAAELERIADKDRRIGELRREMAELETMLDGQQKTIDGLRAAEGKKDDTVPSMPPPKAKAGGKQRKIRMPFPKCGKKGVDIVKLMTDGGHSAEQIVQLRAAMERGLSRRHIAALISKDIPADKMKAIIEIAVLENRLKAGEAAHGD